MSRSGPFLQIFLVSSFFAAGLLSGPGLSASHNDEPALVGPAGQGRQELEQAELAAVNQEPPEIPFEDADVYFELNNTVGDLGIHAAINGGPWTTLEIEDPHGRQLLIHSQRGSMRAHGMAFFGFESAEYPFDELSPDEFFERFPEGEYVVRAEFSEGEEFEGLSEVTHLFPAPAFNVRVSGVLIPEGCSESPPLVTRPLVVTWSAVTEAHPEIGNAGPMEVMTYLLQIGNDVVDIEADLGPDTTEFEVPPAIGDIGDRLYDFEVIVKEEGGNQTIFSSCFTVIE